MFLRMGGQLAVFQICASGTIDLHNPTKTDITSLLERSVLKDMQQSVSRGCIHTITNNIVTQVQVLHCGIVRDMESD